MVQDKLIYLAVPSMPSISQYLSLSLTKSSTKGGVGGVAAMADCHETIVISTL